MDRARYACLEVEGFDADMLMGVVNDTRFEQRLLSGGHFHARAQRVIFPGFSLDCGAYTLPVFASGCFGDGVVGLAVTLRGDMRVWLNGAHVQVGQLMLFAEGRELNVRPLADMWEWAVLLTSREFLQRSVLARHGRELDMPASGWRLCPPIADLNLPLRRIIQGTLRTAASWTPATPPRETLSAGTLLLNAFVDAAMHGTAPKVPERTQQQREALLLRAEMFLLSCMDGEFNSDALCAALGLSERQVERIFLDAYEMGPFRWQLIARLNRARNALQQMPGVSVTEAALQAGFNHLGRFSREYRLLFDELPSETRPR